MSEVVPPSVKWKHDFLKGVLTAISEAPIDDLDKVLTRESLFLDLQVEAGLITEDEAADTKREGAERALKARKRRTRPRKSMPAAAQSVGVDGAVSVVPIILVPGTHMTGEGDRVEVGMARFADNVLEKLPLGTLYERAGCVGQIRDGRFEPISPGALRYVVDRHVRLARWRRDREAGGQFLEFEHCVSDWAGVVHAVAHRAARPLRLLTNHPVYTADGMSPPGYSNGIYYHGETITPIRDIAECNAILDDLVIDFPFAGPADKYNFFALLITALIAPMCPTRPMHVVISSMPRTGKTKLIEEVFGGVILGGPVGALQLTSDEDEREKRIMALAIAGDTLTHLDNIGEFLKSASLCSMLTAETIRGRMLGQSLMVKVPNNLVVVASANNLKATDEIVKRSIPIVLQAACENPENRTGFRHSDLRVYVRENRQHILAALCGLIEAGKQDGNHPLGGFEDWVRIAGGVAKAAGWAQFLANRAEWIATADERTDELRGFVTAWKRTLTFRDVTARELLAVAKDGDFFPFILRKNDEPSQLASLGKLLAKHQGAIVSGCKILRSGTPNRRLFGLELVEFTT